MNPYVILNQDTHRLPFVVSIPHSGIELPETVRSCMHDTLSLTGTDWLLPELYDFLSDQEITVIRAPFSRYLIDVNRNPAAGAGGGYSSMIYQKTPDGQRIYTRPLSPAAAAERYYSYYQPYHRALSRLIDAKLTQHPKVYHLDLHSFAENFTPDMGDEDLILSDRNHLTANRKTLLQLADCFRAQGFSLSCNSTRGGHTILQYHRKYRSAIECIQLELRQRCYLTELPPATTDSERLRRWQDDQRHTPHFSDCRRRLQSALQEFALWVNS